MQHDVKKKHECIRRQINMFIETDMYIQTQICEIPNEKYTQIDTIHTVYLNTRVRSCTLFPTIIYYFISKVFIEAHSTYIKPNVFEWTNVCVFVQSMAGNNQADGLLILGIVGSNGNQHTEGFVSLPQTHKYNTHGSVCVSPLCQQYTSWLTHFGNLRRICDVTRHSGCYKEARQMKTEWWMAAHHGTGFYVHCIYEADI